MFWFVVVLLLFWCYLFIHIHQDWFIMGAIILGASFHWEPLININTTKQNTINPCAYSGILLEMGSANERRRYIVTSSLIDRAHLWDTLYAPSHPYSGSLTREVTWFANPGYQFARISNHTHTKQLDDITHPCHWFNGVWKSRRGS